MKILRVFPRRTSYTPDDDMVMIGYPPLMIPEHDEVHISCTFSWDRRICEELAFQWEGRTDRPVRLGGVAYGSPCKGFQRGMYVHKDVTFTSRGCNNNCPWCVVPKIEGKLMEIPITEGRIIQDNNFLQCSRSHKDKVFEMLKGQKRVEFKGGLEADLVDDHFCESVRGLRVHELWLACDTDAAVGRFRTACNKLTKAGFTREHIHCYVLSYGKDMEKDEARARAVYEAGAMPFVQLYRDPDQEKTIYSTEWNAWARMWQRPAAIRAHMERCTDFRDFTT